MNKKLPKIYFQLDLKIFQRLKKSDKFLSSIWSDIFSRLMDDIVALFTSFDFDTRSFLSQRHSSNMLTAQETLYNVALGMHCLIFSSTASSLNGRANLCVSTWFSICLGSSTSLFSNSSSIGIRNPKSSICSNSYSVTPLFVCSCPSNSKISLPKSGLGKEELHKGVIKISSSSLSLLLIVLTSLTFNYYNELGISFPPTSSSLTKYTFVLFKGSNMQCQRIESKESNGTFMNFFEHSIKYFGFLLAIVYCSCIA